MSVSAPCALVSASVGGGRARRGSGGRAAEGHTGTGCSPSGGRYFALVQAFFS